MGDPLLGWDTDQFPTNVYDAAMCMYEIIKAGGFKSGGLNFDAKARRGSFDYEDIFISYISGMDTFALGLKAAHRMIEDGRIEGFINNRYSSFDQGIGAHILSGKTDLTSLENHALSIGEVASNISGRQEWIESVLNQIMFG